MKGSERKEQVLQAAVRAFAKHGYQQTSIEKVCKEAGIGRGTLYQYFEDKENLFREILEDYVTRIQNFMQPFAMMKFDIPQEETEVLRFLTTRFLFIFSTLARDKEIYTILFKEALAKTTDSEDLVKKVEDQFLSLMKEEIKEASEKGILDVEDYEFTANFLFGGLLKTAQKYIFDASEQGELSILAQKAAQLTLKLMKRK